jgi:hypothetical protein
VRSGVIERGIVLPQSEQLVVRFKALLLEALDGAVEAPLGH